MRFLLRAIFCFASCLVTATSANAQCFPRVYVDGTAAASGIGDSWTNAFKTLSEALNAAHGSTCATEIWVKAGTYFPMTDPLTVATSRDSSFRILKDGIKLYGGFAGTETDIDQRNIAANPTILSGNINLPGDSTDNSYHVLTVLAALENITSNTVIDGITVTEGLANDPASFAVGAMQVYQNRGGGVYLGGFSIGAICSPSFANCFFTKNTALNAAGVLLAAELGTISNAAFADCSFTNNRAVNLGGGMYATAGLNGAQANPLFERCVFRSNSAMGAGGLACLVADVTQSTPVLRNCLFVNNIVNQAAGGLFFYGNAHASIEQCLFAGNQVTGVGFFLGGGALATNGFSVIPTLSVSQCSFINNSSGERGGAVAAAGFYTTPFDISNSLFWGNTAGISGADISGGANVNVTHSVMQEFGTNNMNGNSVGVDPLLLNINDADGADNIFGTADDGGNLTQCSAAALNRGLNGSIPAGTTTDLKNEARVQHGTVDIGAYESPFPSVDVSIVSNPDFTSAICTGTPIIFTGTVVNAGISPQYQWLVNNIPVPGAINPTYTTATLTNGDAISLTIVPQLSCISLPDTSNTIIAANIGAAGAVVPTVSVSTVSSAPTICAGESITFTAVATHEGASPSYQWLINGVNAGTNSSVFTTTTLANGDNVSVILTSSETCLAANNIQSTPVSVSVFANQTPSVTASITGGSQISCAGASVTFGAFPVSGGSTPAYQWRVNGINEGTNSNSFTTATLNNNDVVDVILTSSAGCVVTNTATSNVITMTVNPALTPSVSTTISSGSQTICAGNSVTFSAATSAGGPSPSYQWQVNGINEGTNSAQFSSATLNDNDAVSVILTASGNCLSSTTAISTPIVMTVNPNVAPTISISLNAGSTNICAGNTVSFVATVTNGGSAPLFTWNRNGVTGIQTPGNTYTSVNTLSNFTMDATLFSNAACPTANNISSNIIAISVSPNLVPSVSIISSQTTLCEGTGVNFSAAAVNAGSSPIYQWKINGANTGANNPTFSSSTLQNNDAVSVVLTSSESCLVSNNPESNPVSMTVNPNLTPAVNISAPGNSICNNELITFTAIPLHEGAAPIYQWRKNGIAVGTNHFEFSTSSIANNDIIQLQITSSEACLAAPTAISNAIVMTVAPDPVLTLNPPREILLGGSVRLTSTSTQPISSYSWTPSLSLNDPGSASPLATPLETTTYRLVAVSNKGCKGSATTVVRVLPVPVPANTFTPNGDGLHDTWEIRNLQTYQNSLIQVFNRQGQKIFETRGYARAWDGTFGGKPLPADTYYYIIEWNNAVQSKPITGYVTIIR